jgi:hypothetical protein
MMEGWPRPAVDCRPACAAFQGYVIFLVYGLDSRLKIVRILATAWKSLTTMCQTVQERAAGMTLTAYDECYTGEETLLMKSKDVDSADLEL